MTDLDASVAWINASGKGTLDKLGITSPPNERALSVTNSPSEIVVYPDTPHAFFAEYRSSYRQEAAEDGRRLLAWFKQHGVA